MSRKSILVRRGRRREYEELVRIEFAISRLLQTWEDDGRQFLALDRLEKRRQVLPSNNYVRRRAVRHLRRGGWFTTLTEWVSPANRRRQARPF